MNDRSWALHALQNQKHAPLDRLAGPLYNSATSSQTSVRSWLVGSRVGFRPGTVLSFGYHAATFRMDLPLLVLAGRGAYDELEFLLRLTCGSSAD